MNSYIIAYQYFGGMTEWNAVPGVGRIEGLSPVTLEDMTSDKTMVAALIARQTNALGWGQYVDVTDPRGGKPYTDSPAFGLTASGEPRGGNHVFADGSGRWVGFGEIDRLQSWSGNRPMYYFQEDLGGYVPPGS